MKAGLAGLHDRLIHKTLNLIAYYTHFRNCSVHGSCLLPRVASFPDMERMLSDQAYSKGVWGMPWHTQAMKDVARCDKPRVGASTL